MERLLADRSDDPAVARNHALGEFLVGGDSSATHTYGINHPTQPKHDLTFFPRHHAAVCLLYCTVVNC
jgi:hypothetical protein